MRVFSILTLLLGFMPLFGQTAEEILDRNVDAMGGKAAAEEVKSLVMHGKMTASNGMQVDMVVYIKDGGKFLAQQKIPAMNMEMTMGCDGTDCYAKDQMMGIRRLEGQEKEQALLNNDPTQAFHWREMYPKREFLGEEEVNGKPTYKILLETASGMSMSNYYDKESYQLVRTEAEVKGSMGNMKADTFFESYRDVHKGLLFPVKQITKVMNMEMTLVMDEIEVNVDIPDSKFALPEGI